MKVWMYDPIQPLNQRYYAPKCVLQTYIQMCAPFKPGISNLGNFKTCEFQLSEFPSQPCSRCAPLGGMTGLTPFQRSTYNTSVLLDLIQLARLYTTHYWVKTPAEGIAAAWVLWLGIVYMRRYVTWILGVWMVSSYEIFSRELSEELLASITDESALKKDSFENSFENDCDSLCIISSLRHFTIPWKIKAVSSLK